MTANELQLRQLIYGMSNDIIITEGAEYKDAIEEIELIKSGSSIEGFIFRPEFTSTRELAAYTPEDWQAIYAQYSVTYGWSGEFANSTGSSAQTVLDAYFKDADKENTWTMGENTNSFNVESNPAKYYDKLAKDFAESKIVLRTHQKEILALLPVDSLLDIVDTVNFPIRDTKILFLSRLLDAGDYQFKDPQDLLKFLVQNYSDFEADVQLNKQMAKGIKFKMPTAMKKKVYKQLNNMRRNTAIIRMKPQLQLWKRIFAHIRFANAETLEKRFPTATKLKAQVYAGKIRTPRTSIEFHRRTGDLERAFELELDNPGQMVRNLLFYLRYPKGMTYAKKNLGKPAAPRNAQLGNYFGSKEHPMPTGPVKVTTDVWDVINSPKFVAALKATNTKLLWQILDLIKDEKWAKPMRERVCNRKHFNYTQPLPALHLAFVQKVKEVVKETVIAIKQDDNKNLGKVFIDTACKDYKIQFTGREDTSISMSGEYLTPGSKIKFADLLEGKEDSVIRMGIAWRGRSCDVDLALNIVDQKTVYYGSPILSHEGEVVISSSGDITECTSGIFSTEFIDIDLVKAKAMGLTDMFSSAVMYSGPNFDEIECYWFIKVMTKSERVKSGRRMDIALDEMDYAVKLQNPTKLMLGLMINLEKDVIEVLNIPADSRAGYNANLGKDRFEKMLADRPKMSTIYKLLKQSISKAQLTKDPSEADIIISPDDIEVPADGKVQVLHPGRNSAELQKIYF